MLRSLEEKKLAEQQIQDRLNSIPLALHGPFMTYEAIVDSLSNFTKAIKKLKGFVAFLRKLNPVEYLKWMFDAYSSGYIPMKPPNQETASSTQFSSTFELPHPPLVGAQDTAAATLGGRKKRKRRFGLFRKNERAI